jgi:hypothetical protein
LVARLVRDEKVAGSNPVTPTFQEIKPFDDQVEGFFRWGRGMTTHRPGFKDIERAFKDDAGQRGWNDQPPDLCGLAARNEREPSMGKRTFSVDEAKRIGATLGVDWDKVDVDQFRRGLEVELEHGSRDPETDVTNDDVSLTGKIAWAHLKEFPDYYTRLDKLEAEADAYWASRR